VVALSGAVAVKKIAIVPTLLTLGNGISGFASITLASKINPGEAAVNNEIFFAAAGWLILIAMVFDMFDGYVARLSKTASKFGGELDSLCDAISFGVAPAFLLLKMGPGWEPSGLVHLLVAGIAVLYMVCAVLRLARFNIDNTPDPASHKRFRGLPSPAAAGCLASLAILRGEFANWLLDHFPLLNGEQVTQGVVRFVEVMAPLGALVVGLLMVSRIPYPHVSKRISRRGRHVGQAAQILAALLVMLLVRDLAMVLIFWGYALALPLRQMVQRAWHRDEAPTPDVLPR